MRYLVYLMTLLFVGTAIAQNPTIVQGNYITNVFGNSNFVLNPNALTNVANVTNATRSTTTPLVATSEFTLSLASGANATWTLRAFDGGMKGQNCEARFTYRGFATATTKAEIVQNSLVVASLTLTPTTDPRIASINFPCGDLVNATTFRIAQTTANMTGTNEIGGIYVGLATNMANVAQAENVVQAKRTTSQSVNSGVNTPIIFSTEVKDAYNEYDSATGTFTAKRAGDYLITSSILSESVAWAATNYSAIYVLKNDASVCIQFQRVQASISTNLPNMVACTVTLAVGDTLKTAWEQNRGTTNTHPDGSYVYTMISRFPSSSELVVTPERQNVFGGVKFAPASQSVVSYNGPSNQIFNNSNGYGSAAATLYGKAKLQTTGTCGTTNNLGLCIETVPPGTYRVIVDGVFDTVASALTGCSFEVFDGTNIGGKQEIYNSVTNADVNAGVLTGVFNYTSVQTNKPFSLRVSGNSTACRNVVSSVRPVNFTVEPLDQPSNSALYVEGPVKAAATGAAISAGYVGQSLSVLKTTATNLASGAWTEVTSLTLTPGVWLLTGTAYWNRNGANMTSYEIACGLAGSAASMSANYSAGNWFNLRTSIEYSSVSTPFNIWAFAIRPNFIRNDGTNLYFSDGATFVSGSQTVRLVCYPGAFSAGTPVAYGAIEATRLN